jgi:hypothetical protein
MTGNRGAKSLLARLRTTLTQSLNAPSAAPERPGASMMPHHEWNLPSPPTRATGPPELVKFNSLEQALPGFEPGGRAQTDSAIFRHGRMWFQVTYAKPFASMEDFRTAFVSLDPGTGATETISLPARPGLLASRFAGGPDLPPFFEVTRDSLFVSLRDGLQRYRFHGRTWERIPIPMETGAALREVSDRLVLGTGESLLEFDPATAAVQVIASSRRRPAVSPLDDLRGFQLLYPRATNTLGLFAQKRLFAYSFGSQTPSEITLPLSAHPPSRYRLRRFLCGADALLLEMGADISARLFAVWSDSVPPELLIQMPVRVRTRGPNQPPPEKPSELTPRWDWPESYPLETVVASTEKKSLWVLTPRIAQADYIGIELSMTFEDNRNATLFRFEPASRQPLTIPLRFEKDGQSFESLALLPRPFTGFRADLAFFLETPDGLFVVSRFLAGHWLVPQSTLASRLEAWRQTASAQPKAQR